MKINIIRHSTIPERKKGRRRFKWYQWCSWGDYQKLAAILLDAFTTKDDNTKVNDSEDSEIDDDEDSENDGSDGIANYNLTSDIDCEDYEVDKIKLTTILSLTHLRHV